jgi:hypothetical protein
MELVWIIVCILLWTTNDTYDALLGLLLGLAWKLLMD